MISRRIPLVPLLLCLCAGCLASGCGPAPVPAPVKSTVVTNAAIPEKKTQPTPDLARPAKPAGTIPVFRTIDQESGFAFERNDDIRGLHRITESNGGGVAVFDFDRDGWHDIFMTNGCRLPLSLNDRSSPSELFRNRGGLLFGRVTSPSGIRQFGYAQGCAVGDYDGDGFDDLYVTAFGPNALWHNNGDGTFADVTRFAGVAAPQWSSSAAFGDLNNDGHLDLYVANYLEESDESPQLCPNPASPDGYEQCPPAKFPGADDVLYFSDGAGRFEDVTAATGIARSRGKGLGVVISDLDGDRFPEIYVANDGEANFLWTSKPESEPFRKPETALPMPVDRPVRMQFVDVALSSGCALSEAGYAQASMGIAAGDYDANGTLDFFLTHFYNDTNTLYANRGGLVFEDVTRGNILGSSSRNRLGFGTAFLDADNDGWLDLLVANGHVDDRTWLPHGEPYRMRPQFFRNEQLGEFVDVSDWCGDYFLQDWLGRGVAVGDLDRDGRYDAVISHQRAHSVVIRNETVTGNSSLELQLVGVASHRNGWGARAELLDSSPVVVRELVGGASFQSASAPEIHLGLGHSQEVAIRISWPSGQVSTLTGLTPGTWVVVEGSRVWKLHP